MRLTASEREFRAEAYRGGMTLRQIANMLGVTCMAVYRTLLAEGVEMRPAHRPTAMARCPLPARLVRWLRAHK